MTIAINKAHFPVTVLGPGKRIGIWFQGCSIHCRGCLSSDTWREIAGQRIQIKDLLSWCRHVGRDGFDGVTITGGEPFEQHRALRTLLGSLHAWRSDCKIEFDLLCYSGMPYKMLLAKYSSILALLDAIIPEPFQQDKPQNRIWRGSSNQPLIPLSPLGRKRYSRFINRAPSKRRGIQLHVGEKQIWFVGIPRLGDLEKLQKMSEEKGLLHKEISWRS